MMCRSRAQSKAAADVARDNAVRFHGSTRSLPPSAAAKIIQVRCRTRVTFPLATPAKSHHRHHNRQRARCVHAGPAPRECARQPPPYSEAKTDHLAILVAAAEKSRLRL